MVPTASKAAASLRITMLATRCSPASVISPVAQADPTRTIAGSSQSSTADS
ncbi:hypothetical protein G7085_17025 [Tessaracoccus sp. HDW20]|nr:hypothetical protein [Tessaracoccus coleopterorum]